MARRERDKVDLSLIVEGGRRTQPTKRVQGIDYPETITKPPKKTREVERSF
jgi:hypothetical protein